MQTEETVQENQELSKILVDSKLELSESEQIKQSYLRFFNDMANIKADAVKINFETPTELDEKIARDLRLRMVKVRTGSEEVKNERKRIHMLKANVEQDAWNLIKSGCLLEEERFLQVEKKREIAEVTRKSILRSERMTAISCYTSDASIYPLGEMTEQGFEDLFSALKISHQAKIDKEKRIEAERISKEKADREERERLKKELEAKEALLAEEKRKSEIERQAAEAERQRQIEDARKEREASEAKARQIQEENDRKLQAERQEREKAEQALKAKAEAERQAEADKQAAIEAELSKGDKEKFQSLLTDLSMLKAKYKFTSKKHSQLFISVCELIDKIVSFSTEKLK